MIQKIKDFFFKHEPALMAALFIAGFLFDLITLSTIDDTLTLSIQTFYLVSLVLLLTIEFRDPPIERWPRFLHWFYGIKNEVFHFFLGALLSAFTIFYFKSSSLANSFIFMVFMAILLVLNEFPLFKKQGLVLRLSMLTLCLMSYHLFIISIALKSVSQWIFLLSLLCTLIPIGLLYYFTRSLKLISGPLVVCAIFSLLYTAKLIPPVPLALTSIGVYQNVERVPEGGYRVSYERPWWRFWHRGDQRFLAREASRVWVFSEIFSPGGFEGNIIFHWRQWRPDQGWVTTDRISLPIQGGRQEGYRAFTNKSNFTPGLWQVRLETPNGLEVGRIQLRIIEASDSTPPSLHTQLR
jgi:hypothetical protein